jgi:DNA polymerase/3'-5' exonuclease PolX
VQLAVAQQLAAEVKDLLSPCCRRLETAGGIRREKAEPHDIELVAVAELLEVPSPEVLVPCVTNVLQSRMTELVARGTLRLGDPVPHKLRKGKTILVDAPFSEKYYRVKYKGQNVDLFVVSPPAQWGVVFTIRTGDREFSHWLVQQGYTRGFYFSDGRILRHVDTKGRYIAHIPGFHLERHPCRPGVCQREVVDTPEERDVFQVLNIPWKEPKERVMWQESTSQEWEEATLA